MKILKKIKKRRILIIGLLIVLLGAESITFAKHVVEQISNYFVGSKDFYFSSNILKEDNPRYEINNWSGVGEFLISFDLTSKKNTYIKADYDITYEASVRCPNDVLCSIDKTSGTIYSSTNTDTLTVSVSPTRLYTEGEKIRIEIQAESKSPYVKKISAVYEYIVGKLGTTYEINDAANRTYLLLNVTNAINYCTVVTAFGNYAVGAEIDSSIYRQLSATDKAKCVGKEITLNFNPNTIILDTTSNIVNTATVGNTTIGGVSYVSSLNFYIEPLSTMAIKFYKLNVANDYTYPITNQNSIVTVTVAT